MGHLAQHIWHHHLYPTHCLSFLLHILSGSFLPLKPLLQSVVSVHCQPQPESCLLLDILLDDLTWNDTGLLCTLIVASGCHFYGIEHLLLLTYFHTYIVTHQIDSLLNGKGPSLCVSACCGTGLWMKWGQIALLMLRLQEWKMSLIR